MKGGLGRWVRLCAAIVLFGAVMAQAEFSNCRMNFGMGWDGANRSYPAEVDYITIWIGDGSNHSNNYNPYWEGDMAKYCMNEGKTPVFYSYIIAFMAKNQGGLKDCDVGSPNLCEQGTKYIRDNRALILDKYDQFSKGIARDYGKTKPVIWLLEPDFYQYASDGRQQGGVLTFTEAGSLLSDMITKIKANLPMAQISIDISPWNNNQGPWLAAMPMAQATYMHTSGGRTEAGNARIRMDNNNNVTWAGMYTASGNKGIIADDGYGVGGGSTGHDASWDDVSNLNARIADGVVAITQANPKADWGSTIATIRPRLNQLKTCGGTTTYALTLTAGTGGTVAASPNSASYAANAVVSVTATPSTGYKFAGWTGDATGTTNPLSVTMTAAKKITATFAPISTKPQYTLTVKTTGNGSVTRSPDQATYDSGATVQLTAVPGSTASFLGWTGGVTGTTTTASIKLLSSQIVTAAFSGVPGGDTIGEMIKNGKFTDGTTNWGLGLNGGTATGTVVDGQYVTTTTAAGSAHWHIQMTQGDIKLEAGKTYTFSFEAAADAPRTIVANVGQSGGAYTSYIGTDNWTLNLTTRMTKFSKTFKMTTSDQTARVEFNSGNAGTVTWRLDNVSLKEGTGTDPVGQRIARAVPDRSLLVAGSKQWKLQLGSSLNIEFSVFDPHGRRVTTWSAGRLPAGESSIAMPANILSVQPGLYLVEARGEGFQARSTWSKMD